MSGYKPIPYSDKEDFIVRAMAVMGSTAEKISLRLKTRKPKSIVQYCYRHKITLADYIPDPIIDSSAERIRIAMQNVRYEDAMVGIW